MRALLVLALAAALGGCASPGEPGAAWTITETPEEGLKLVLGTPATDDVQLAMTCVPGSGMAHLTILGRAGDPAVVELRSGKFQKRYSGAGVADPENDGALDIQFDLDPNDPVLARVADTGELTVMLGRRKLVAPNGFAQVHDFLTACRTAH